MNKNDFLTQSENYRRIEKAILYIEQNFKNQPTLEEIAQSVNLSKFHFQRLFKSWAGVSPSQFLHYLTVDYAKSQLRDSRSVFETSLNAGLSSAGRLHDLFVSFEAMSPGEYKQEGAGLTIHYGFHPTPFGRCVVAVTKRGICGLRFLSSDNQTSALDEIRQEWLRAEFIENPSKTDPIINKIFSTSNPNKPTPIHLHIKGTNFQVNVWQALLMVPFGSLVSYQTIANSIHKPSASQAVGNAIARNPIAYIIPCHRVIKKTGKVHNYRWGTTRKQAIVGWEAARMHQQKNQVDSIAI